MTCVPLMNELKRFLVWLSSGELEPRRTRKWCSRRTWSDGEARLHGIETDECERPPARVAGGALYRGPP